MSSDDDLVETGLVAAAVTPRPAAGPMQIQDFKLTDPVPHPDDPDRFTAAAVALAVPAVIPTAPQMPDGWNLQKVAALVGDVAQNMYDLPYILKKNGLTADQYDYLNRNEFFQRALEAEIITWQGANSIQKRLALESAIAVEAALPTIAARMSKPTEPLGEVVALLKVLSEIAGTIGAKAQGPQASGEKFKIIINLGGDIATHEVTANPSAIRSEPEGQSPQATLQSLVQTN